LKKQFDNDGISPKFILQNEDLIRKAIISMHIIRPTGFVKYNVTMKNLAEMYD